MRPPQFSLPYSETHLRFVLHKHQATRLHYDLRLEYDGRLLDWALPKGPSLNPWHRRLAISCPDHNISCLGFEGRIPRGAYGAGPLLIADRGRYWPQTTPDTPPEEAIRRGLRNGYLHLFFAGHRLKGAWTLKRFQHGWLFVKSQDAFVAYPGVISFEPSVVSGKTLDQL